MKESASARIRWLGAEAVSVWMAAHYRSTGQVLTVDEAAYQIDALVGAIEGAWSPLPDEPSSWLEDAGIMARSLKALAPAAASVARYSFGRNAIDLLGEVTQRLATMAFELAARLSGTQVSQDVLSSPLYMAMLEVAGLFYKQAHRGEMDRLLSMPADERRAYVRAHDRRVPMEPVWDAVDLQLGMLEAMAAHIPLPAPADGAPL
jgi:hypothetical protein